MVHALGEIQRVLGRGGVLLDLRPVEARWRVEVVDRRGVFEGGRLLDSPAAVEDDRAADRALQEAEARGWYQRVRVLEFPLFYYWDTPTEMREFIHSEWDEGDKLPAETFQTVRSQWATAEADARVRVRTIVRISKWGKR